MSKAVQERNFVAQDINHNVIQAKSASDNQYQIFGFVVYEKYKPEMKHEYLEHLQKSHEIITTIHGGSVCHFTHMPALLIFSFLIDKLTLGKF